MPFYLFGLPHLYGFPRLGGVVPILVFAVPFVLAVSGLGLVVAAIFRSTRCASSSILAAIGLRIILPDGICLADGNDPARRSYGFAVGPEHLRDRRIYTAGSARCAARRWRGETLILSALAVFYSGVAWILETGKRRWTAETRGSPWHDADICKLGRRSKRLRPLWWGGGAPSNPSAACVSKSD